MKYKCINEIYMYKYIRMYCPSCKALSLYIKCRLIKFNICLSVKLCGCVVVCVTDVCVCVCVCVGCAWVYVCESLSVSEIPFIFNLIKRLQQKLGGGGCS